MKRIPLKFCPACGSPAFRAVNSKQFECTNCGFVYFQNVAAAAGAIIEAEGKVLLVERAKDPDIGMLDLPGGFVDPGETLEAALARELDEELGLQLNTEDCGEYLCSAVNEYPYQGVLYHSLDLFSLITLDQQPIMTPADDVGGYEWYTPNQIPLERVAFSSVKEALNYFLKTRGIS